MKQILLRTCLAAGLASLALSCSLQESDILDAFSPGDRFYARIESSDGPDTKVYADDKLRVLFFEGPEFFYSRGYSIISFLKDRRCGRGRCSAVFP